MDFFWASKLGKSELSQKIMEKVHRISENEKHFMLQARLWSLNGRRSAAFASTGIDVTSTSFLTLLMALNLGLWD